MSEKGQSCHFDRRSSLPVFSKVIRHIANVPTGDIKQLAYHAAILRSASRMMAVIPTRPPASSGMASAIAEEVLGGFVPIANDPLAVRRNDHMRDRRERCLRDGSFACRSHGGFYPLRGRCTCELDCVS
jgi:hypothetical protein